MGPFARLIRALRKMTQNAAERRSFKTLIARGDARLMRDAGLTLAEAELFGLAAPVADTPEPRPVLRPGKVLPFRPIAPPIPPQDHRRAG